MKKLLLLSLIPLSLTSCSDDLYEGDKRVIIEGKITYNNTPLHNAQVDVYPVYNVPKNGTISEIKYDEIYDGYGNSISKTFTDNLGNISISIPRNEDTEVYVVKISRGNNSKYYGYISNYNTGKFYLNLGTLSF